MVTTGYHNNVLSRRSSRSGDPPGQGRGRAGGFHGPSAPRGQEQVPQAPPPPLSPQVAPPGDAGGSLLLRPHREHPDRQRHPLHPQDGAERISEPPGRIRPGGGLLLPRAFVPGPGLSCQEGRGQGVGGDDGGGRLLSESRSQFELANRKCSAVNV